MANELKPFTVDPKDTAAYESSRGGTICLATCDETTRTKLDFSLSRSIAN